MVDKENKRKREKYRNLKASRTKRVFFLKNKKHEKHRKQTLNKHSN